MAIADRYGNQVEETGVLWGMEASTSYTVSIMLRDMATTAFSPVGYCIYCGSDRELSREHFIPVGLGGIATLPKSSCSACAKVTGKFEEDVLRGPMWAVRVLLDLKSRTKHRDAPKSYSLVVVKDGQECTIDVPASEYPILLQFPRFGVPDYLLPPDQRAGLLFKGHATISYGPTPEDTLRGLGGSSLSIGQSYRHDSFARMIAKIAYAYAIADGAMRDIEGEPLISPAIVVRPNEIGMWVGTLDKPLEAHPGMLHRIQYHRDEEKGLLCVEVQLFSEAQTPSYGVIIGKLK